MYDSKYMTSWKRQNYAGSKKISDLKRLGERRHQWQITGDFQGMANTLYNTMMDEYDE